MVYVYNAMVFSLVKTAIFNKLKTLGDKRAKLIKLKKVQKVLRDAMNNILNYKITHFTNFQCINMCLLVFILFLNLLYS